MSDEAYADADWRRQPHERHRSAGAVRAGEGDLAASRHPVAHCHLGLGKISRHRDQREQAQEHLGTATTMYREMDMRYWLDQAEAELGALG